MIVYNRNVSNPGRGKLFSSPHKPSYGLSGTASLRLKWYGFSFRGVKRPGRRVDHLPPSSSGVKRQSIPSCNPPRSLHGVDRDHSNFLAAKTDLKHSAFPPPPLKSNILCMKIGIVHLPRNFLTHLPDCRVLLRKK
jgi:hypothetical protein